MLKLLHLHNKKIPNSYFIKRVNQRLGESIQNKDIQDQLYNLFDPSAIKSTKAKTINNDENIYSNTDANINSNSHKQLTMNKIYMTSFIDLNDKRSIFKKMYGEFCNINNYESVLGKQKRIFELKDFFDDSSLKFLLAKLKKRNKQKLLNQLNSNSNIHHFQNKHFKRKNFNDKKIINSYFTSTYDKYLIIPSNKESKTVSSEKDNNELINCLNNFNTLDVSKNSINNSTQRQKYFGQFSSKSFGKFQTLNNNDSMIPTKTIYDFVHKNKIFNNNNSTNKKFKTNINSFLSNKKFKQKRLEIQSKTQSILDKNRNIRNKIFYLKSKTNSYTPDESKDIYLQSENNYLNFKESPIKRREDISNIFNTKNINIFSKTKSKKNSQKLEELNKKINKLSNRKQQIQKYFNEKQNNLYTFRIINDYVFDNKNKNMNGHLQRFARPPNKNNKKLIRKKGKLYMSESHFRLSQRLNEIKSRGGLIQNNNSFDNF